MTKASWYIALLCILTIPLACKKGGCNVVEYVPFNATISLVEFDKLRLSMQPVVVDRGGVAGLVIMQVSEGKYVAYDRCSTVNPAKRCAVELDEEGPVAVDPCSGAKYILTNGSPAAIAECPLKPYYVDARQYRQGILTVSN